MMNPHMKLRLKKYAHLCASHGTPVKAAPVRPRLCTSISVTPMQAHVTTTQVGTHPVSSAASYKRSASATLAGTHIANGADPRAGSGPFPKPRTLVLPTSTSCIINTDSLSFSGIQARRAGTPPTSLRRLVEGSIQLLLRIVATRTLPSCSTRIHLSLTLRCLPSRKKLHKQKYLEHGSTHRSSTVAPPLTFLDSNGHILLSTQSQCRCQET